MLDNVEQKKKEIKKERKNVCYHGFLEQVRHGAEALSERLGPRVAVASRQTFIGVLERVIKNVKRSTCT